MKSIKKLSVVINEHFLKKFIIPTDMIIKELNTIFSYYLLRDELNDSFIFYLKDWFNNNSVDRYPLIDNYDIFYNSILDRIIFENANKKKLSSDDLEFFQLLSSKYCYENINRLSDKAIDGIANSAEYSFKYAYDTGKRFFRGESVIMKSSKWSYFYIISVIRLELKTLSSNNFIKILERRFVGFLNSIFKDPYFAFSFVKSINIIYPSAEKVILKNTEYGLRYILEIVYPILMDKNSKNKHKVLKVIRNRYQDFENNFIFKFSDVNTLKYFVEILLIPDAKVEDKITDENVRNDYLTFLIKYYTNKYYIRKLYNGDFFYFIRDNLNEHTGWVKDRMKEYDDSFIEYNIKKSYKD